jgi:hypothetical protein
MFIGRVCMLYRIAVNYKRNMDEINTFGVILLNYFLYKKYIRTLKVVQCKPFRHVSVIANGNKTRIMSTKF